MRGDQRPRFYFSDDEWPDCGGTSRRTRPANSTGAEAREARDPATCTVDAAAMMIKRSALGLRHPMGCRRDHWPSARSRGGRRAEMRHRRGIREVARLRGSTTYHAWCSPSAGRTRVCATVVSRQGRSSGPRANVEMTAQTEKWLALSWEPLHRPHKVHTWLGRAVQWQRGVVMAVPASIAPTRRTRPIAAGTCH